MPRAEAPPHEADRVRQPSGRDICGRAGKKSTRTAKNSTPRRVGPGRRRERRVASWKPPNRLRQVREEPFACRTRSRRTERIDRRDPLNRDAARRRYVGPRCATPIERRDRHIGPHARLTDRGRDEYSWGSMPRARMYPQTQSGLSADRDGPDNSGNSQGNSHGRDHLEDSRTSRLQPAR